MFYLRTVTALCIYTWIRVLPSKHLHTVCALISCLGNLFRQAETPKSQDLSLLALYALTCQAFVFFASVEFAFLLLVERVQRNSKGKCSRRQICPTKPGRKSTPIGNFNQASIADSWIHKDYDKFSNVVDKFAMLIFFITFVIFNLWYFLRKSD